MDAEEFNLQASKCLTGDIFFLHMWNKGYAKFTLSHCMLRNTALLSATERTKHCFCPALLECLHCGKECGIAYLKQSPTPRANIVSTLPIHLFS